MHIKRIYLLISLFIGVIGRGEAEPWEEEILFAQRVANLYQEKEYDLAIKQIYTFFKQYPSSRFNDTFYALLADSHRMKKRYDLAIEAYMGIKQPELKKKCFKHLIECVLNLGDAAPLSSYFFPSFADCAKTEEEQFYIYSYLEALQESCHHISSSDRQEAFYTAAEKGGECLSNTPYECPAKLCFAKLNAKWGKMQKAISIYTQMCEKYPENREDLLLRIAGLQVKVNPEEALLTASKVQQMKGERLSDALLLKTQILLQLKLYGRIIEEADELLNSASEAHQPALTYYVAQASYALKKYDATIKLLEPFVSTQKNSPAISLLIASCYENRDIERGDSWMKVFEASYPQDEHLPRLIHLQGKAWSLAGDPSKALALFNKALMFYPNANNYESMAHERNLTTLKMGLWSESRAYFLSFIDRCPESGYSSFAIRQLPYCTQKMIEKAKEEGKPIEELQRQLIEDLDLALKADGAIVDSQRETFLLAQGEALLALKDYSGAIKILNRVRRTAEFAGAGSKALLLLSQCYLQGYQDYHKYIACCESALNLDGGIAHGGEIYYNLFKAYMHLLRGEQPRVEESAEDLLAKASSHLWRAFSLAPQIIEEKLRFWLADRRIQEIEKNRVPYSLDTLMEDEQTRLAREALILTTSVLGTAEAIAKAVDPVDRSGLQKELYQLGRVYGWLGEPHHAIAVLESPGIACDHAPERLFALASLYETVGQCERAEGLFKEMLRFTEAPGNLILSAKLHYCRMLLERVARQGMVALPEVDEALDALKQLAFHKRLQTEPLHLEAALDYARYKALLRPIPEDDNPLLELLKEQKKEFTLEEDLCAKDYHASRKLFPELDKIYQAYMLLMDADIASLEAKAAKASGCRVEARRKSEAAKNLYKKILEEHPGINRYLITKVKEGLSKVDTDRISKFSFGPNPNFGIRSI